jgi:oxygen-dependent protoporphyrinogen oxidase
VIGSGIAGLAAAYSLQAAGYNVTIFEAGPAIGGRMKSAPIEGLSENVDLGAQFLNDGYTNLQQIIHDLNLAQFLTPLDTWQGSYRGSKIFALNQAQPSSLCASGFISYGACAQIKLAFDSLPQQIQSLPLNDFSKWTEFDDGTAADWLYANFGNEATEYIARPQVESLFFLPLESISKAMYFWIEANYLRAGQWYVFNGGTGDLASSIAQTLSDRGVKIHLSTPIAHLKEMDDGKVQISEASGSILQFDAVIVATSAPAAKNIIISPKPYQSAALAVDYVSSIVIDVFADQEASLNPGSEKLVGVDIPKCERVSDGAIASFSLGSGEHSQNPVFLDHELYGFHLTDSGAKNLINLSDIEIISKVVEEANKYLSQRIVVEAARVQRWPNAIPVLSPGRSFILKSLWDQSRKNADSILLAGDYTSFPTLESAAWSGMTAAQIIIQNEGSN